MAWFEGLAQPVRDLPPRGMGDPHDWARSTWHVSLVAPEGRKWRTAKRAAGSKTEAVVSTIDDSSAPDNGGPYGCFTLARNSSSQFSTTIT